MDSTLVLPWYTKQFVRHIAHTSHEVDPSQLFFLSSKFKFTLWSFLLFEYIQYHISTKSNMRIKIMVKYIIELMCYNGQHSIRTFWHHWECRVLEHLEFEEIFSLLSPPFPSFPILSSKAKYRPINLFYLILSSFSIF